MDQISSVLAGYQESLLPEVQRYWLSNYPVVPEPTPIPPESGHRELPQRKRRYSPKGQASGWIEERQGNRKRKVPCTSFYYCWYQTDEDGKRRKMKVYIPNRQVESCRQLIEHRCSISEILAFLNQNRNQRLPPNPNQRL